jgi:hypothetical protein
MSVEEAPENGPLDNLNAQRDALTARVEAFETVGLLADMHKDSLVRAETALGSASILSGSVKDFLDVNGHAVYAIALFDRGPRGLVYKNRGDWANEVPVKEILLDPNNFQESSGNSRTLDKVLAELTFFDPDKNKKTQRLAILAVENQVEMSWLMRAGPSVESADFYLNKLTSEKSKKSLFGALGRFAARLFKS